MFSRCFLLRLNLVQRHNLLSARLSDKSHLMFVGRKFDLNVKPYSSLKLSPAVQTTSTSTAEESKNKDNAITTEAVPKKKLIVKLKEYSISLYNDYKDVLFETITESKEKPVKATIYIILLGTLFYCILYTPTEKNFWDELITNDTQFNSVGKPIRNPSAEEHLRTLTSLRMKGILRYQSLGFCSIIWHHNDNKNLGIYHATCKYTRPLWLEMWDRIVDVGFVGKWWIMEKFMEDYDINPQEWEVKAAVAQPSISI